MPTTTFAVPLLFAALGLLYLMLGIRSQAMTSVGANPARKARFRISAIFLVISVCLLYWSRRL